MRLIDADALDMYERLKSYYGDAWRDAQKEIDNAPTVDAIPIEFIKSEIARMKEGSNQYYSECIAYAEDLEVLISEWESSKKNYGTD